MKVSIHQPNYLPWMGLIQKIYCSDTFVLLDDVQLVRGKSFVLRTKIKTTGGPRWITIPVKNKTEMLPINEIKINNSLQWREDHWNKIEQNYNKSKFFSQFQEILKEGIFREWENLAEMNYFFIKQILDCLKIKRKIIISSNLNVEGTGIEKIINIVKQIKGDEYFSGEGKGSIRYVKGNEKQFEDNNIKLTFQKFEHPIYEQLHGDFVPKLSIWDSIFNIGPEDTLKKISLH